MSRFSVAVHITSPVLLNHYIRFFYLAHRDAENTQCAVLKAKQIIKTAMGRLFLHLPLSYKQKDCTEITYVIIIIIIRVI